MSRSIKSRPLMETRLCSKWSGFSGSFKNWQINKDVRWPSRKASQWFSTGHNSSRHKHHQLQTRPSVHHRARIYQPRILELTVPFKSPDALAAAKSRKSLKSNYLQLATDLEDSGWSVSHFTQEIGSLGHFGPNATRSLSDAFLPSKQKAKQVLMKLSTLQFTALHFQHQTL